MGSPCKSLLPGDLLRRKGSSEALILLCVFLCCCFQVTRISLQILKWGVILGRRLRNGNLACVLLLRVAGREPQACPDLISSGRGRKTTQQNSCPDESLTYCVHTTRPRVVGLPFLMNAEGKGEAWQGFPLPWTGRHDWARKGLPGPLWGSASPHCGTGHLHPICCLHGPGRGRAAFLL